MFIVIFFLSWILYTSILSQLLGGYFILLWLVSGILVGYLAVILTILLHFPIFALQSIDNRYKHYVIRSAAYFVLRFIFNVTLKTEGLENLPKKGPLVVYANHKSYIDAILLIELIKRPSAFTPKSSLYNVPFLRFIIKTIGCMPIYRGEDRKTVKAMVKTIDDLKKGFCISVFPEGGRKDVDTDEVKQTKAGSFKLAYKSESTILPVSINNNSLIRKNAPWKHTKVFIKIHQPITYAEYKDLTTFEISEIVADKINQGLIKNENS